MSLQQTNVLEKLKKCCRFLPFTVGFFGVFFFLFFLFFSLLACPFVSRVISFICDVRVRGVVSMFNEPLILSLCGVVRERLLPCRVVVG